ncbi:hypothetical protein BDF14DRAFT_1142756 [Spinellus fusiger]|nr:hypothetical protein BDF14DRAFT_1142756 [Spinellus fusiger]
MPFCRIGILSIYSVYSSCESDTCSCELVLWVIGGVPRRSALLDVCALVLNSKRIDSPLFISPPVSHPTGLIEWSSTLVRCVRLCRDRQVLF